MGISDLTRREFTALTVATTATWHTSAAAKPATPMLYPAEELIQVFDYPALVRFEPGQPGFPLVVFITGGGVLARIAYGPPVGRAADFLCHWLHEEGFASLALSYPVDRGGVFDVAFPQFSIADWAEQSRAQRSSPAASTRTVCPEASLCWAGAWQDE